MLFHVWCAVRLQLLTLLLFVQERRWFFIRNGSAKDYHGPAVHWRHLSRWERHVGKIHLQYDPVADLQQRREASLAKMSYSKPLINVDKNAVSIANGNGVVNGAANGVANGEKANNV